MVAENAEKALRQVCRRLKQLSRLVECFDLLYDFSYRKGYFGQAGVGSTDLHIHVAVDLVVCKVEDDFQPLEAEAKADEQ